MERRQSGRALEVEREVRVNAIFSYLACNCQRAAYLSPMKIQSSLTILGCAANMPGTEACPLYTAQASCGWPSPADDYIDQEINLHEMVVRNPPATFFLRAAGDSMIGVGIHDGDLLVVDRSLDALPNRIVIAALDGELLVKKLARKDGKMWLLPANKDFRPIDITHREYVHIWGVVTYVLHKL